MLQDHWYTDYTRPPPFHPLSFISFIAFVSFVSFISFISFISFVSFISFIILQIRTVRSRNCLERCSSAYWVFPMTITPDVPASSR